MKMLVISSVVYYLSLISSNKKNDQLFVNPVTNMDTIQKTYLALGDSYTIGESVSAEERFPAQTVQMLTDLHFDISEAHIIATTGWTTTDLINSLNVNPPQHNYSFVSLLIGVNNQYQHRSLDEYKFEFAELVSRAISYAGNIKSHVFVLSIPDYSVTPFADASNTARISKEIDDFNETNKAISLSDGVHYLDITQISREAKNDPSLIAGDGLHPSSSQYKMWSWLLSKMLINEIR